MKTYILAPGSYGDIVADKLGMKVPNCHPQVQHLRVF